MSESYVYAITDGTAIKIGVARHPHKRIKALSTGNALRLRLLGYFSGGFELEKQIHSQFEKIRHNGEWLYATPALIEYLNTMLVDVMIVSNNGQITALRKMPNLDNID